MNKSKIETITIKDIIEVYILLGYSEEEIKKNIIEKKLNKKIKIALSIYKLEITSIIFMSKILKALTGMDIDDFKSLVDYLDKNLSYEDLEKVGIYHIEVNKNETS